MKTNSRISGGKTLVLSMAFASTLFAVCAGLGTGIAMASDEVAVWHIKITATSSIAGQGVTPSNPLITASASVEESLTPLILEFDVNQDVETIRDTLKASYVWSSKERQTFEGAPLFSADGQGQGSCLEDWEVVLSRHFNPLPCHSGFYIDDDWERQIAPFLPPFTMSPPGPGDGGPGTSPTRLWITRVEAILADKEKGNRLEFSIRAEFPVTVISHNYDSGETTSNTWTNSFQDSGKVEYAFQLETQGRSLTPETGVFGSGVMVP